jgi:hypothetical protein
VLLRFIGLIQECNFNYECDSSSIKNHIISLSLKITSRVPVFGVSTENALKIEIMVSIFSAVLIRELEIGGNVSISIIIVAEIAN